MKTNIKAFKKLIKRYETITLDEIVGAIETNPYDYAKSLTGFGERKACTLCLAIKEYHCEDCIHRIYADHACNWKESLNCIDHKTYDRISNAKTPRTLLNAYRARARYMRTILDELKYKQP